MDFSAGGKRLHTIEVYKKAISRGGAKAQRIGDLDLCAFAPLRET
jgi:hypothetical protein